jgi:hypothetical protein
MTLTGHQWPKIGAVQTDPEPISPIVNPCCNRKNRRGRSPRNVQFLEALTLMSFTRSLLRRIPEPSVQLFMALAMLAAAVVTGLAVLDGSGNERSAQHVHATANPKN